MNRRGVVGVERPSVGVAQGRPGVWVAAPNSLVGIYASYHMSNNQ